MVQIRYCRIVTVDKIKFGFMPERGTIDAVFILRRLQEEYHAKGKRLCICSVNLEKAFAGMGNEEERNTRCFG